MTTDKSDFIQTEDQEMIFSAIIEHSKDGLFITDQKGRVVLVNRAYAELFDVNVSELIGKNVKDLFMKGTGFPSVFERVIKSEKIVSIIQRTYRGKNILSTGTPIFDERKRLRFIIFNDHDILHLASLIETLERKEIKEDLIKLIFSDIDSELATTGSLVAESPTMTEVLKKVVKASKVNIPIILWGESGVGKSKIAKLIHYLSDRKDRPFVDINCGAIPENLLESELFGYERGAFTGAAAAGKKGLFEAAREGTLFLDEINELPKHLQVKLFKFIESNEMTRVGGIVPLRVDTRIIAATNRDLKSMVERGEFRSELYFRLSVVPIHIPPLRERKEDIIPLIQWFFNLYNKRFKTQKSPSKSVLSEFIRYNFPGNVRELENLVKRLVAMTDDNYIRTRHLKELLPELNFNEPGSADRPSGSFNNAVLDFERNLIKSTIKKYGSQNKAAKVLGLNQSTISRKLKES